MEWPSWAGFLVDHWGDLASVASLVVTGFTFSMAKKARAAAEGARLLATRRNLTEELQDLQTKTEQVGLFLLDKKWDLIHLRCQEIVGGCSKVATRWKDELSAGSRSNIMLGREQARSIAVVAMRTPRLAPREQALRQIEDAQERLHELISAELGLSVRSIETSEE